MSDEPKWKRNPIKIRGIQGWTKKPKCEVVDEHGESCRLDKGHEAHDFPTPRLAPAEALKKIQEAAKEGLLVMATDMEPEVGGFVVQWSIEGYGFGEITVWSSPDGSISVDSECMSREFCEAVMMAAIKQSKLLGESMEEKN